MPRFIRCSATPVCQKVVAKLSPLEIMVHSPGCCRLVRQQDIFMLLCWWLLVLFCSALGKNVRGAWCVVHVWIPRLVSTFKCMVLSGGEHDVVVSPFSAYDTERTDQKIKKRFFCFLNRSVFALFTSSGTASRNKHNYWFQRRMWNPDRCFFSFLFLAQVVVVGGGMSIASQTRSRSRETEFSFLGM